MAELKLRELYTVNEKCRAAPAWHGHGRVGMDDGRTGGQTAPGYG